MKEVSFLKDLKKQKVSIFFQKNFYICLSIVVISFLIDRVSKIKVIQHQLDNTSVYVNDFFNIELVWNTGIGFGLFSSNLNITYNIISALIACVLIFIIYLIFTSKLIDKLLFSLVLGGALGNFYDRLFYMAVPDFIDFHYQRFHWFTFNIADIFITIGIIAIITKDFFFKNEKNK